MRSTPMNTSHLSRTLTTALMTLIIVALSGGSTVGVDTQITCKSVVARISGNIQNTSSSTIADNWYDKELLASDLQRTGDATVTASVENEHVPTALVRFRRFDDSFWIVDGYLSLESQGSSLTPAGGTFLDIDNGRQRAQQTFRSDPFVLNSNTKGIMRYLIDSVTITGKPTALVSHLSIEDADAVHCQDVEVLDSEHQATGGLVSEATEGIKNPPDALVNNPE